MSPLARALDPAQLRQRASGAALALLALALCACRQEMYDQPRYEPLEPSTFFADGRSARPLVAGTVPRGAIVHDPLLTTGKVDGEWSPVFPAEVTAEVLERGRERYGIFCAPCHDALGTGDGMIVRRGFPRPVSFHVDRLRQAPPGYFFDVITNGRGAMYDYSDRVPVADRWAIVAWIRVLQRSTAGALEDVPPEALEALVEAR